MSKALPGVHLCKEHQGNHSHYAPENCELCQARAEIERLREAMTGWSNYAWKDGVFVDDLEEFFDAILAGKDSAWLIAHRDDWMNAEEADDE